MNKKEKIKKWFKDHFTKEKIMPWVLTFLIMLLVLLCVYFENKDKNNMESKTSDISLVETDANLNKSWSINQDGNLVGNNLLNINNYRSDISSGNYISNNSTMMILTSNNVNSNFKLITLDGSNVVSHYFFNLINTSGFYTYTFVKQSNDYYLQFLLSGNSTDSFIVYNIDFLINGNTYTISLNLIYSINEYQIYNIMLNEGSTTLAWEPYGVWYSQSNYDNYGTLNYNDGRANAQNQYYYFNDKRIYYYADESSYQDNLVGYQYLQQSSYTDFTINATDIVEPFYEEYDVNFYYGRVTMNYLSKDFYANFIYGVSDVDGYIKIVYADGSQYLLESYSLNRSYHIYDGAITNPDKVINYIEMQFQYDKLLSIDINTSVSSIYYNNGYNSGYNEGYSNGNYDGLQVGRTNGYNEGYQIGLNDGAQKDLYNNGMRTLFDSILSYPVNMLSSVFNFEFMGINIASTIFFLISCGIVLWIIKRLWK